MIIYVGTYIHICGALLRRKNLRLQNYGNQFFTLWAISLEYLTSSGIFCGLSMSNLYFNPFYAYGTSLDSTSTSNSIADAKLLLGKINDHLGPTHGPVCRLTRYWRVGEQAEKLYIPTPNSLFGNAPDMYQKDYLRVGNPQQPEISRTIRILLRDLHPWNRFGDGSISWFEQLNWLFAKRQSISLPTRWVKCR